MILEKTCSCYVQLEVLVELWFHLALFKYFYEVLCTQRKEKFKSNLIYSFLQDALPFQKAVPAVL